MKKTLVSLTLFLILYSTCEAQLEYGQVKEDKKFCKKAVLCSPCDSSKGFPSICNSQNEFELRLIMVNNRDSLIKVIVLGYDNLHNWFAKESIDTIESFANNKINTKGKTQIYTVTPPSDFVTIFQKLKENDVFILPDQSEIGFFTVSAFEFGNRVIYKAGHKFRSYTFGSVDKQTRNFPAIEYFKKCNNVLKLLTSEFEIY